MTILQKIREDLNQAETWLPAVVNKGEVSRGAALHLLAKVNLAMADFDGAINAASKVIDGGTYALMTQRFGSEKDNPARDVTWDLHRPENKSISENTEAILNVVSRLGFEGAGSVTSLMTVPMACLIVQTQRLPMS
jgi:hypothetical protein